MTGRRGRQQGFSLAEVVVALGLLASVLISIAGLLVLGNRLMHRGRGSSEALEVARDILEETGSWTYSRLVTEFGCDATAPDCTVAIDKNSPISVVQAWYGRLQETGGPQSAATIRLASIDDLSLALTAGIRIHVVVEFREGPKLRTVDLLTVRM